MTTGDDIQVVTFRLGGQEFAFSVFQVERILRYEGAVTLPDAPSFLEGVFRYGDGVIPVVDFRKRLSVEAPVREDTRVMVLELQGERVGVVVDAVTEVMRVDASDVVPPPKYVKGLAAKYITGIISRNGRTIVLLTAHSLLTSKERLTLRGLTEAALEMADGGRKSASSKAKSKGSAKKPAKPSS